MGRRGSGGNMLPGSARIVDQRRLRTNPPTHSARQPASQPGTDLFLGAVAGTAQKHRTGQTLATFSNYIRNCKIADLCSKYLSVEPSNYKYNASTPTNPSACHGGRSLESYMIIFRGHGLKRLGTSTTTTDIQGSVLRPRASDEKC